MSDLINILSKGTDFLIGEDASVLTTRDKVPTPITVLNCLFGGGIPFGTVLQSFGPPKVGKSTWLYQMVSTFQQSYPEGLTLIIDTESSTDPTRLNYLGVDTSKFLRLSASSIESGFLQIQTFLDNIELEAKSSKNPELRELPIFIIWDTLKGKASDDSKQSRMNAQDRARVIKNRMPEIISKIEKYNIIFGILNQVIYNTDSYGNVTMNSGGGIALKHDVHLSAKITEGKINEYNGSFLIGKESMLSLDKSKISPELTGIPVYMDIRQGGRIDEARSFVDYLIFHDFIPNSKGWYKFDDILSSYEDDLIISKLSNYNKSYRLEDLVSLVRDNKEVDLILQYFLCTFLSTLYGLQSIVIEPYLKELKSNFINNETGELIEFPLEG